MSKLLDHINSPKDIREFNITQLETLASELRNFIINIIAVKEGHLGASLGVTELAIALHYVYNTPHDKLVWDVGHQAYPHKILTGRRKAFHTNRQLGGISGFPKITESEYDDFGTGHSSTSISAVLGMAIASKIQNKNKEHIAVIGDASIASGMAFEALNHAGETDANLTVILNDNAIGIDPSVGALKNYLTKVKSSKRHRQPNIIEALNFEYTGPIDGHDLPLLIKELKKLKNKQGPKLLHIITTKGKGLRQAEENQITYHAPGKFDASTGDLLPKTSKNSPPKFSEVLGNTLLKLAKTNKKIVTITPAMPTGSGLNKLMDELPERTFDVGIAEQHAVTLAAGMATQGLLPFCVIYSTFLQRAYDQIIHDVALQNLPVIFCIDRAGLVGKDGATHHGVFDLAYLNCIPNLCITAPKDEIEFQNLLYSSSLNLDTPIAIRYPRGNGVYIENLPEFSRIDFNTPERATEIKKTQEIAVITTGKMSVQVSETLRKNPLLATKICHQHLVFVKPISQNIISKLCKRFSTIITVEDGVITGGFGSNIIFIAQQLGYRGKIECLGIPDKFIDHGTTEELYEICGLSVTQLAIFISKALTNH